MLKYYDRAWNPVFGCRGCFDGCDRCYAVGQMMKRGFSDDFRDVCVNRKQLNRKFEKDERQLICVCTQSDLFQDDVNDALRDRVMRICNENRQDEFMTITKFTGNMLGYFSDPGLAERLAHYGMNEFDWENMKFGTSVCTAADLHRIDELKRTPVIRHRFLAFDPLLEDISKWMDAAFLEGFEWVIAGSETGDGRTPCDPEWIRGIVSLADKAGVPVFVNGVDVNGQVVYGDERPFDLRRSENPYSVEK